jgi:hypothetical protein
MICGRGQECSPARATRGPGRPSLDERNRDHSRPLARQPLSRRLEGRKEEMGRGRGGWDDFLRTVEVAIATPLFFWPLTRLGERGSLID